MQWPLHFMRSTLCTRTRLNIPTTVKLHFNKSPREEMGVCRFLFARIYIIFYVLHGSFSFLCSVRSSGARSPARLILIKRVRFKSRGGGSYAFYRVKLLSRVSAVNIAGQTIARYFPTRIIYAYCKLRDSLNFRR